MAADVPVRRADCDYPASWCLFPGCEKCSATHPKRGAGERAVSIAGHAFTVGEVREMLREQGLHVVMAADKAVLDGMSEAHVDEYELRFFAERPESEPLSRACAAELARREAAK